VKTACLSGAKNFIVAKLNTNFPQNYARFGLPTIQGAIVLFDADNGRLLAVLDSMEITLKRTAAATAVAAKYLARKNSSVATICGCGEQGHAHFRALSLMFPLRRVYAFDIDPNASQLLAAQLSRESQADIEPVYRLSIAIQRSDVVVTCTPATEFYVHKEDVAPGTFIAPSVRTIRTNRKSIRPSVVGESCRRQSRTGLLDRRYAPRNCAKVDAQRRYLRGLSEVVAGRKPGG
jgi:ornithine cyclodeaminase/alanine dehydrogenase